MFSSPSSLDQVLHALCGTMIHFVSFQPLDQQQANEKSDKIPVTRGES